MGNKRIKDLPNDAAPAATDRFAIDGATTRSSVLGNGIAALAAGNALPVASGGTGASTLTSNGILLGNGAGVVSATAAMSDGQVLVGQTGAAPLPRTATNDLSISAAGAFTIGNNVVTNAKAAQMATMTVKSNITGGTANSADNTLSAIIDAAMGSTRGSVLYRGATTWSVLTPGTSGYVLQTNGAGANPSWAPGAGSFAPIPQTAAGLGQFVASSGASGVAFTLPAGGTWAWWGFGANSGTGAINALASAGVSAGGTAVMAATGSTGWIAFAWRVT